jgi:hypothetical protein
VRFPCVHAAATTPVQRMGVVFARIAQPCQPSPVPRPDRPAHRPFRGLLSVHSRCGLHTRTVTVCRNRYPKASDTSSPPCLLRSLPAGAVAGWGLHPLERRRLVTAHADTGRSPRDGQLATSSQSCHSLPARRRPPSPDRPFARTSSDGTAAAARTGAGFGNSDRCADPASRGTAHAPLCNRFNRRRCREQD